MGGGAVVLPGASSWCSGNDVVQHLNKVFDSDPTVPTGLYQIAKNASLTLFQDASTSGRWQDLLAAYVGAFDAADPPICGGWGHYLEALGDLGANIVTTTATTSAILTFGAGNVPSWMANGLSVYDYSTPGAITSGQTVYTFDNTTVTLTAPVDTMVNPGDTIVFSAPGLCGNIATSQTATASAILTFGAGNVPAWMANGLNVYDSSTPGAITGGQTVSTFDNKTVTLTAPVNATVNSGDTIVFSVPPGLGQQNIRNIALTRYQALTNNVKMKTFKHPPHDVNSSGHVVKVTPQGNEIWIDSPYIPLSGAALRRSFRESLLRWLQGNRNRRR